MLSTTTQLRFFHMRHYLGTPLLVRIIKAVLYKLRNVESVKQRRNFGKGITRRKNNVKRKIQRHP